ncbi:membrane protein [Streptococcus porcinus]|uniref:YitT family protein n=1 Tax=Streptococcus porcinus TaxID=1340 RepID=A0A4V0A1N7_STRPO|nr:YitT family protein [Streptococcus porcinus]MBA2795188.1 YitT family protein [Streptococcus porcinus]VTS47210.1 membrane protein [Streptococcus porcinus]
MPFDSKLEFKKLSYIIGGSAVYAFAFVYFYMANRIAANGMSGLTLVGKALFNIDPIISGYLINLPLVFIGAKYFGRRSTVYTVTGVLSLYFFVWMFQKIPLLIDLNHDKLVISLMAGIIGGLGGGLVFRSGGTIGGSDIIGKVIETKFGLQLNQALLGIDIFVMILSLTYISIPDMMYALIASFMYGRIAHIVQNGGYSVRGAIIVSDFSAEISQFIMEELGRGVTYLNGEGAYSAREKKVIYAALSRTDVRELKDMISEIDPRAFVSIFDMDEINSPDFFIPKKKKRKKKIGN